MIQYEEKEISDYIKELARKLGSDRSSLLPMLQEIQFRYGYIGDFAQQEVAQTLDIHPVEVNSVISFYAFLYDKPRGKHMVRLCRTIMCDLSGSNDIANAVCRELGIRFGDTTADGNITLEFVNCLGMCDKSPAMLVNNEVYTGLDPEKACKILRELK